MRKGLFKVVRSAAGASLLCGGFGLAGAFWIGLGSTGVGAATPAPLVITTTSPLPDGLVTVAYSATVAATGGTKPYTWSATGLPTGLHITTGTGKISGTPTTPGTSIVTVTVTGATAKKTTKTLSLTIESRITLTTTSLASGTVTVPYTETLVASGGEKPYTWSATGLPTGLHITTATGKISGIPTKAGTSTVTIKVTTRIGTFTTMKFVLKISPAQLIPAAPASGYDLAGSDGGVFVFPTGQPAGFYGSLPGLGVKVNNIVGMVPTAADRGYFLVGSDGGVFAFGTAPFLGSLPGLHVTPAQPIAGIVAAHTDKGYFLVGKDGGVFAFGTVPFLGSLPGRGISVSNIIGIASTPSGDGYWLVSATGTVYGFGAAQARGTAKGTPSPVSSIAGTPTGGGYWIVTQNGTVYPFGNATKPHPGTLPALGVSPAHPVIGIVHTSDTAGYWLIGSDGGVFAFGDAGFVGSLPGVGVHVTDVVGAVPTTG